MRAIEYNPPFDFLEYTMRLLPASLFLAALITAATPALAAGKRAKPPVKPTQPVAALPIELAHPLGQVEEVELQKLVDRYNGEHPSAPIKLVRWHEGGKPAIMNILRRTQVADFSARKNVFVPLYVAFKSAGENFEASTLSRDLRGGVADDKGRVVALPISYSTAVLYYDRNAFRKAGLDPEHAPTTWNEMQDAAGKLLAAGHACPLTTSWPAWVHVDNVSALAGAPVVNAKGDLAFNGFVEVRHLAKLSAWKKAGLLQVFGRRDEGDDKFRDGECAMLTSNSSSYVDFLDAKGVEVGVAALPHYDDSFGGRQNTLADGASLWFGAGYKPAEYRQATAFVKYLLKTDTQMQLVSAHGRLPMTDAARATLRERGPRGLRNVLEVSYESMKGEGGRNPVRVSAIDPVRIILEEELERLWADKTTPKQALDEAVARGNALLKARPTLKRANVF